MELDPAKYDTTRHNVARVYHYLLDGEYFTTEKDQQMGELAKQRVPVLAQFAQYNRWFLSHAVQEMARDGITNYLDLGSGLPTQQALHELLNELLPHPAKVLYTDHDPEAVRLSMEILDARGQLPEDVLYLETRIQDTATIFRAAEYLFQGSRRIGACLVGIAYMVDDDSLQQLFQELYNWAEPGSMLAVSSFDVDKEDAGFRDMAAMYASSGTIAYPRSSEHLGALVGPWKALGAGWEGLDVLAERALGTEVASPDVRGRIGYGSLFIRE